SGDDAISYGGANTAPSTLSGGADNDFIVVGGSGPVTINGNGGNDRLVHQGTGAATINGGDGNDQLIGSSANDVLNGDDGNDVLDGVAGAFNGGNDDDLLFVTIDGSQNPTMTGGGGTDSPYLTLSASPGALTISSPSPN